MEPHNYMPHATIEGNQIHAASLQVRLYKQKLVYGECGSHKERHISFIYLAVVNCLTPYSPPNSSVDREVLKYAQEFRLEFTE